jgi:hypothetical protein
MAASVVHKINAPKRMHRFLFTVAGSLGLTERIFHLSFLNNECGTTQIIILVRETITGFSKKNNFYLFNR